MTNGIALGDFILTTRDLSSSQYSYIFGAVIRVAVIHSFTLFLSKLAYLFHYGCATWSILGT